jgi:CheY-like chemotaxis protein
MEDRAGPEEADDGGVPRAGPDPALSETLRRFSHDIRAAVSDVVGGLRLIDTQRLDPETRTQLDRVRAAGDTLAGMIDSALMAASGETFVMTPGTGLCLREIAESWRRRWTGRAAELGARFDLVVEGDLPSRILAPRLLLDRIVCNLVSNALIHGGGRVRVALSATAGADLVIAVADDGAGFSGDETRGPGTRPGGGHGLGLQIAREMCRHLDGALHLDTGGPFGGAVARVSIPDRRLDWRMSAAEETLPDLSDLRILVAEDNLTNQTLLRQMLERMGAAPVIVADGAEALQVLACRDFDIALVDIEMPRVSGLELMRAVRTRGGAAASMPLVALTAYVLRDNREAIYAAGADAIIGKPVASAEEFGRAILRHTGRPAGLPEPEDVLSRGGADRGLGVRMDEAQLDELLSAAGPDGARELLDRLDEDLRSVRGKLSAGVRARSVPEIRAQTHILIALSGAVGAERLSRLAEVLNIAAKRGRMDDLDALHAPCRSDLDDLIALIGARAAALG